jgi:hypothetical protein
MMAWLIAAQRIGVQAPPAENQGPWFTHKYDEEWGLNGELPLAQMLKDLPSSVRQDGPVPEQWKKATPDELGRDWDYRLNYLGEGVKLEEAPSTDGPYWKVVQARWFDVKESGGATQIFVKALDADGEPLENAGFVVSRVDAQDPVATKGPVDEFWGNYTMFALLGTYSVEMTEGGHPSERVTGVGLGTEEVPDSWASTSFRFTFQLVEGNNDDTAMTAAVETGTESAPAEETESEPDPEASTETDGPAVLSEAEMQASLEQAALEAAKPHLIPLNPDAALYRYARQHDLGERLSHEFNFEHGENNYVAQAFEKGVVYVPIGEWDQVTHVEAKV